MQERKQVSKHTMGVLWVKCKAAKKASKLYDCLPGFVMIFNFKFYRYRLVTKRRWRFDWGNRVLTMD